MRKDFYITLLEKQLRLKHSTKEVVLSASKFGIIATIPETKTPISFIKGDLNKIASLLLPSDMLLTIQD